MSLAQTNRLLYPQRKILQRGIRPLARYGQRERNIRAAFVLLLLISRIFFFFFFFCFNTPCQYTPLLNLRSLAMAAYILLR